MREALARVRHDAVVSSPARATTGRRAGFTLGLLRKALPARARGYAGAMLAAMMAAIVVNALTLQHARHPSPFFTAGQPPQPVAARNSPEPAPPASVSESAVALPAPPEPPARPVGLGAASEPVSPPRTADPIADLLRAGGNKESQRLISAAQNALVKLGYSIRTGGSPGADTSAALRDFEKAHGLPLSTEITSRLVRILNAAVSSSSPR